MTVGNINILHEKYPWLKQRTTVEEYISPNYYDKILREYVFDERSDLAWFLDWLRTSNLTKNSKVLELGCGSGRVTKELLQYVQGDFGKLTLLDLSNQMLAFCKNNLPPYENIEFINSDCISYMQQTSKSYHAVYSLWSFSHSVHQHLSKMGLETGVPYVRHTIRKFLSENLSSGATFFLIHFDSLSDEQRILMKQWARVFPIFINTQVQSPSKQLIDAELSYLQQLRVIDFNGNHYIGSPIVYSSINEALEYFLNFHMETYFNDAPFVADIISELTTYFSEFTREDGTIAIAPGCFIYEIKKN